MTMNLYFPDSWTEQASRDMEYELFQSEYTGKVSSATMNYIDSIGEVDYNAYKWALMVACLNLGLTASNVPAWYYTHQRDPNAHDRRWFDGTENQQDEQGNNSCTSWEEM